MYDYLRNGADEMVLITTHMSFYDVIIFLAIFSFVSVVSYKYILLFYRAIRKYNYSLGREVESAKTTELIILGCTMIVVMLGFSLGITSSFFKLLQIFIVANIVIDLAISIAILFFSPEWIKTKYGLFFELSAFLLKVCIVVWPTLYLFYGWYCFAAIVLCLALLVQILKRLRNNKFF